MKKRITPSKTTTVVKWTGGKRKALPMIHKHMPKEFNRYFECFLGGGSLFFSLSDMDKEFFLNDFNSELIAAYRTIRDTPLALIENLSHHKNDESYFMAMRHLDREEGFAQMSEFERASRFLFLNRAAFNGLWRVNKSNQHNVSFGHYKALSFPSQEAFLNCSNALKKATIFNGDFESMKEMIQPGDFVYLDPAYEPISKTSSFTQYTNSDTGKDLQSRLKAFCDYIHGIGAYFMQSNSVAPFILETYKEYNIVKIKMPRSINCKGGSRGKVSEVLIKNY